MASLSSDQLEEETLTIQEDEEYDEAPFDVMGEHESVGNIVVALRGESLPKTTKYKRKDSTCIPVKFFITKKLEVTSIEFVPKSVVVKTVQVLSPKSTPTFNSSVLTGSASLLLQNNPPSSSTLDEQAGSYSNFNLADAFFEEQESSSTDNTSSVIDREETVVVAGPGPSNRVVPVLSESEFLRDIMEHFETKIIGGLEAGLRQSVLEKLVDNMSLLPKENNSVVNSMIQAVFDHFGPEKPDYKFCEKLAGVLKAKFPSTFNTEAAVNSPLGPLALPKSKGQGGFGPLAKRIGNNRLSQRYSRKYF